MAATRSDERQRKCCLDNVRIWSSGPAKKSGGLVKNRHGGAPGGARALSHRARGTSQGARPRRCADPGAPLLLWREKEREGGAPRQTFSGADESCPYAKPKQSLPRRPAPIKLKRGIGDIMLNLQSALGVVAII